jgi:hypothetical protein
VRWVFSNSLSCEVCPKLAAGAQEVLRCGGAIGLVVHPHFLLESASHVI